MTIFSDAIAYLPVRLDKVGRSVWSWWNCQQIRWPWADDELLTWHSTEITSFTKNTVVEVIVLWFRCIFSHCSLLIVNENIASHCSILIESVIFLFFLPTTEFYVVAFDTVFRGCCCCCCRSSGCCCLAKKAGYLKWLFVSICHWFLRRTFLVC